MSLSLKSTCTGIIGVGNMGEALLAGLIQAGVPAGNICFSEKRDERAAEISSKYGANRKRNLEIAQSCSVILLVTKPQDLESLLTELSSSLTSESVLVSFAAGKTTHFIEDRLTRSPSVIRVMPNTPALIGKGMAAISAGKFASDDHVKFVRSFLEACGEVVEVTEDLQDAVTAASGSGPAYFFAFVESMVAAGIKLGLSEEVSTKLAVQTIYGAAGMLLESGKSATTLRENVTSPNGTTAAALKVFSDANLDEIVLKAMTAARDRSQELA
jgi:pyrroline-5-carboxylate reductase